MAWLTRLLVVANQTADSAELAAALRARAEHAALRVTLVVPATPGGELAARQRLTQVLGGLRSDGIEADGMVGDADPVSATLDAWDPWRYDEIVLCTLPAGESTWLHVDLPHRLRRLTDATIQHVVAPPAVRPAATG